MTNKELLNIYDQYAHCKTGYCCQNNAKCGINNLKKLGYNSGIYGWNWTVYADNETDTLYISAYRNIPKAIKEK